MTVAKISFDNVVIHWFSDSMHLVIHKVPPDGAEQINIESLTYPDRWKLLSQTSLKIYLK